MLLQINILLVAALLVRVSSFQLPSSFLSKGARRPTQLSAAYFPSSGSDAVLNGGSTPFSSRRFYQEEEYMGNGFMMDDENRFMGRDFFIDRDFPYQNPMFEPPPPPPIPPRNGGMDPEVQKYFRRNSMANGDVGYGDVPLSGEPSVGRSQSVFSNQGTGTERVGQSQRYYSAPENVYDAELYRDEDYYDRINQLFPVLSRIQGINWQGSIRYLEADLTPTRAINRSAGLRYDLEANGSVFLTITLGGRRIEMRGQLRGADLPSSVRERQQQQGLGLAARGGSQQSIQLDPVNEADPNFMIITELAPDTILINEIDRYTGKIVLTASLSIASDDELIQVSHDVGDLSVPIEGHQVWTLSRSDKKLLGTSAFSSQQQRQPSTGIPRPVMPSVQTTRTRGRPIQGAMGRLFPVLSKFAGITWEGNCRQVNGDLRVPGMPRPFFGGTRYDILDDGSVLLTTFLKPTNGRLQTIEMRGRRVDGAGSAIRLDMDRGPNSMIITELAPHTLMMNEVNRETGRILFTASLFLASDNEVVQVSHQVSGRDPRMPIDLHQVWRLSPSRDGLDKETEWREREEYGGRTDRSFDLRGRQSVWDREDYRQTYRDGRRSVNGLLTEPPRRSSSEYRDVETSRDHLWLLKRSPQDTRDRLRATYDRWDDPRVPPPDVADYRDVELDDLDDESFLSEELRKQFPVLSQIVGIDWKGTCRYIIGDTKPDSILLLNGGMRYDLSPDGVCTMTTTVEFADGKTREVTMTGYRERSKRFSTSMRLYPLDDESSVYTILTEISPDTILLNEVDSETDKVIYTASLSLTNDRKELVQVTHELGDGLRMPVEGHQVWRMKRDDNSFDRIPGLKRQGSNSWVPSSSSSLEELFPVLSKIEGTGWQGTFRFINGDLERQTNFEATGKMWYDLNRNGTCVMTIVSSLTDGSSRYVQMRGERGRSSSNAPLRLDPIDMEGTNYMVITELPPDTLLLSEIDRFTGKLVSTASLSVYRDEIIQVSHEMGNSTRLDGHQITRMRRSKERSSSSRGSMSYLLNGDLQDEYYGSDSLVELFPVLNQIDGVNWQGYCKVVNAQMKEERSAPMLSGGMRYDLHRNGTCTMTSVLMHPDGRTHQIKLQGTRVGKSSKRSIRLDPISEDSPFYTVLTEVPPDTILLNEVDKATNKVIFTASVSIANPDELIQISHDVDVRGKADDNHKIWRLRRSPVLGRNVGASPNSSYRGGPTTPNSSFRGQTVRPTTPGARPPNFRRPSPYESKFGTPDVPFGQPKPKDPNLLFDY